MDAYDGSLDFYIFDKQDPIIGAYSRIYPGLFKDAERMPEELKAHVRYPQEIFEIQMAIYAKYHQTDPEFSTSRRTPGNLQKPSKARSPPR